MERALASISSSVEWGKGEETFTPLLRMEKVSYLLSRGKKQESRKMPYVSRTLILENGDTKKGEGGDQCGPPPQRGGERTSEERKLRPLMMIHGDRKKGGCGGGKKKNLFCSPKEKERERGRSHSRPKKRVEDSKPAIMYSSRGKKRGR